MNEQKIQVKRIKIKDKKLNCPVFKVSVSCKRVSATISLNSLSANPEIMDFQYISCNHLSHSQEQRKTKINRIEKIKILKYLYSF